MLNCIFLNDFSLTGYMKGAAAHDSFALATAPCIINDCQSVGFGTY